MGRPKGTKNNRRSPEEKESIVLELINGEESSYSISRKYGVSRSLLWTWVETYRNEGIRGFSSKVGKHKKGNPYATLLPNSNLLIPILTLYQLKISHSMKFIAWLSFICVPFRHPLSFPLCPNSHRGTGKFA